MRTALVITALYLALGAYVSSIGPVSVSEIPVAALDDCGE